MDQPQRDHSGGVRNGNGQPQEERVTGRAPAADKIGADHSLAVSGGEGVHRAPCRCGEEGQEQAAGGKGPAVDDLLQALADDLLELVQLRHVGEEQLLGVLEGGVFKKRRVAVPDDLDISHVRFLVHEFKATEW